MQIQQDIFQENYEMLNNAQKEVVEQIYGPVMVVAGPGTGKTQIIALRTANIILKAGISPENILITTFTEAGVIAIKKRLVKFIGTEAYKVKISTIHSFSSDIISSFPEKFAEYKASNTIDDISSLEVLTDILDKNIKNNNITELFTAFDRYMYLRDIKNRIGKLKGEGVTSERFEKIIADLRVDYDNKLEDLKSNKRIRDLEKRTAKDSETYRKHIAKLNELNFIYKIYSEYLRENSLYDFSDMINFVVDKMRKDEDLRTTLSEKYQFIMVDEYQDTNNPQNEIMNLILKNGDDKNIMTVGDDDQSIYRFQGANIENMLDFSSNYPDTKFIVLENNYRSSQSILDLSTSLIENNSERLINRLDFLDKKLIAQQPSPQPSPLGEREPNGYFILQDEILEKIFVLDEIQKNSPLPQGRGAGGEGETFAIIVRSNREVEEWTNFMQGEGIEVESKLKTNILKNKFVEFILDFLKLVENPSFDDEKFLNILRSDLCEIENIDVITLARELYRKNYSKNGFKLSLWDIVKKETEFIFKAPPSPPLKGGIDIISNDKKNVPPFKGGLGGGQALFEIEQEEKYKSYNKIIEFRDLILELNGELGLYGIGRLFQKVIDKLAVVEYIEANGSFSDLEDVFTLFNKIKSFNENNINLTLKNLLNKFELHLKYKIAIGRQILKKSNSNIEILTAHSSKGLEYDYVFIPGTFAGNWESKRIVDKLKLPMGVAGSGLQFSDLTEKELKNIEKETQMQEDRRLFFVAMTRAKKELIFTRPAGKENKPYIDSPFVVETGIEPSPQPSPLGERGQEQKIAQLLKNKLTGEVNLIKVGSDEINYISEFLENYKLSPTDLNTFLEDPKEFLKNVVFKYPFTGNEFTIFGNVYHRVLELATMKKMTGEKVELGYMTETFLFLLGKQILTAEERDRLTKKGLEGLTGYFEIFNNNLRESRAVEYNFRSRNVVFGDVRITGKIDKVEKIGDSLVSPSAPPSPPLEGGMLNQSALFVEDVAVVDYKTGGIKTEGKIKGVDRYGNKKDSFEEGKYYRQLLFYKLLAENDSEFTSQFNVTELALDFVEGKNGEYKYVGLVPENDDYEEFKNLVIDSWKKINSLDFWREFLGE